MANKEKVAIIGGSGLENSDFLKNYKKIKINSKFGMTSSSLIESEIDGVPVVYISRHGTQHSINPTNVNYRANIEVIKKVGCTHILAVTACGSLREKIKPGDFIFPDQFIDRTTKRASTFYDENTVKHIPMGEPFNQKIRSTLAKVSTDLGYEFHDKATLVTIEGPRFSTKAESNMFRSWGCDIINMSTVPECVLAKEVGLKYQPVAMSTDYDCWRENGEQVTIEQVYDVMSKNISRVIILIKKVIPLLAG